MKAARPVPLAGTGLRNGSSGTVLRQLADVLRLQPLGALDHFELHFLALGEGAESLGLDGGVVAEDVLTAAVLGDEAVALGVVEPLHSSSRHSRRLPSQNGSAEIAESGARPFACGARRVLRGAAEVVNHAPAPGISPSGRTRTSRGLAPSPGAPIPSPPLRSIMRAARVVPTRSLRCWN